MLDEGLVDEVKSIMEMNLGKESTAMQAIGYKEIIEWLEGRVSFEEAVETLKMESRRYAKRQLTWFRRDERINWIMLDKNPDVENIITNCKKIIAKQLEM